MVIKLVDLIELYLYMEYGGILCYVKDGILYKERSDLQTSTCNVEALWIEITLPHTKPILKLIT